jgi:hypothetical protein
VCVCVCVCVCGLVGFFKLVNDISTILCAYLRSRPSVLGTGTLRMKDDSLFQSGEEKNQADNFSSL